MGVENLEKVFSHRGMDAIVLIIQTITRTSQFNSLCRQLITLTVVLLLTTSGISAETLANPPDLRCTTDNGLAADETDCSGFLLCLKGKARRMDCSKDLRFNHHKLVCDYQYNVQCGDRPIRSDDYNRCYAALVNVTLKAKNEVKAPQFDVTVTVRAPRQALRYILLMAAGLNPTFRYATEHFQGYGDYVSSFNGVSNDVTVALAIWTPYDKNGQVMRDNIDDYYPEHGDVITYVYTDASG